IVQELEEAHIYIAQLNQKDAELSKKLASTEAELAAERRETKATEAHLEAESQVNERTQGELSRLKAALQKLEKSLKK
ncbi:MAG TPA: hypothetical protein VKA53_01985, partial [Thermoanaerobaculia bacterium]|nr:hypothetical protein [Thermoanaerobaculia bacterium]